jgi:deoxyribonuclease V
MTKISWPKDIPEARALQEILRKQVRIIPLGREPRHIAAVDASFFGDQVIAVACLYSYPDLNHIQDQSAAVTCLFPYVPGFLSFREGPGIVRAIKKLSIRPDVILFDGQGIAHPRNMGIASHVGVILNMPTIGCAKSLLVGTYEQPHHQKGSWSYLRYQNRRVGVVVRTRTSVRPLFVSPGHMIDIRTSLRIIMKCITQYRSPEPLRHADTVSRRLRQEQNIHAS